MFATVEIGKDRAERAALFNDSRRWFQSRAGNIVFGILIPTIVLCVINFICFYRSLYGYFAADDFVHVAYLAKVFDGHPELLLQNFVGNWMQAAGTQFYRPFITLTLAWDYLVGGAGGVSFHLSNLLFQVASTIFLFLLVRRIAYPSAPEAARLLAFFTAALFAACPLHCEVVSWVIGRVDSVCTAFYLAAFWLFLKSYQDRSSYCLTASLAAFVFSLMSKEMAVTLPPAVTLFLLMQPLGQGQRSLFKDRLKHALRATAPLWLCVVLFLGVRTTALGTFTGGYSGSVGDSLTNSIWKRFFEDGSLFRIVFPFNAEVFSPKDWLKKALMVLYVIAGAGALLRLLFLKYESGLTRIIGFAAGWFLIALVPTYQVFNIAPSLQCSRFAYLGTAALSLFLASLIIPVCKPRRAAGFVTLIAGGMLLSAFVVGGIVVTQKNNLPFVHGAEQIRTFRSAIESELDSLPAEKKLAILNVPERLQGAHMIYNGAMLSTLLSPPLSRHKLSERVISFEPAMWGEPDMINASRLRHLISDGGVCFYHWDMDRMKLFPVPFGGSFTVADANKAAPGIVANTDISFDGTDVMQSAGSELNSGALAPDIRTAAGNTLTLLSPKLQVNTPSTDFIDIHMSVKNIAAGQSGSLPLAVVLSWRSSEQTQFPAEQKLVLPVVPDGSSHRYRFNVSEHKSWIKTGNVAHIALDFPFAGGDPEAVHLEHIDIRSGDSQIPKLAPVADAFQTGNDGTLYPKSSPLQFQVDAGSIEGAAAVRLEVSPVNTWFEHRTGTFRDETPCAQSLKTVVLNQTTGKVELALSDFPISGFYEVRVFALDNNGHVLGCASDPLNLQLEVTHP